MVVVVMAVMSASGLAFFLAGTQRQRLGSPVLQLATAIGPVATQQTPLAAAPQMGDVLDDLSIARL